MVAHMEMELEQPNDPPEASDEPDESLLFEHIGILMNKDLGTGTNEQIEEGTRRLYTLMAAVGLWTPDAFHAAITKYVNMTDGLELSGYKGSSHWSDLARKEHFTKFARLSQEAARKDLK